MRSQRSFLAATRAVAAKLRRAYEEGWPYPSEGLARLGCRRPRHEGDPGGAKAQAELRMEVLSPSRRAQPNDESETLREVSFSDRDFELLFEPRKHGALEDPGLEAQMGFLNLTFADWFLPFWEDYDPFGSDADDGESA